MTQNVIDNTASQMDVDNIRIDGNTISSTNADGNIIIAPNGTGAVSVTTAPIVPSGDRADSLGSNTNSWDNVYADGLTFDDGTNTLANYLDTTSWTPTIDGVTTVGVGTYTTQIGRYARVGNMVFLSWHLVWTAHTGTGQMRLGGIPLPSKPNDLRPCGAVLWGNGKTIPAGDLWEQVVGAGGIPTQLFLQFSDNVGNAGDQLIDAAASLIGSIYYPTA